MAAGVPVIATPVGAIPDVMSDGIHGFLVPPRSGRAIAEALAALACDRERISWMSRACRRRIGAAFSVERVAREFSLHYARLCGVSFETGVAASHPYAPREPAARAPRTTARVAGRKG